MRAVDISKTFVEIAQRNAAQEGVAPHFELGNAAALPLADATADPEVCRAAFKNFTEPVKALKEMRRVLRPGGTALLIDMRRDAPMSEVKVLRGRIGRKPTEPLVHDVRLSQHADQAGLSAGGVSPHGPGGWVGRAPLDASAMGFEAWLPR